MGEKTNYTTFEEHLEARYGKIGTKKRDEFEIKAKAFMIGEMIKETRKKAKMTQEQLAEKTGTKKSYISRLENGKIDCPHFTPLLFPEVYRMCQNFPVEKKELLH
jgi:DNA-binding XRE family transcriptional regulator